MNDNSPILTLVIPCYNESKVLPLTCTLFLDELNLLIEKEKISPLSKILFVDDGSKDNTWELITKLSQEDSHYSGISLSRNRGHQNALLAGLMEAMESSDVTISIDCDGQDDVSAIEKMIDEYLTGHEVVYGVRTSRETDTFWKRFSAVTFYKLMKIMGANVIFNHADYRLVSSRVLREFAKFKEVNLFLRGLIPLVGFKSSSIYFECHDRVAGKSHYSLNKMLTLALDGITSLTTRPLQIIFFIGIVIFAFSLFSILWNGTISLFGKGIHTVWGLHTALLFLGGIQLISVGVLGEYIGKIYSEVKARPRYIIAERTQKNEENK